MWCEPHPIPSRREQTQTRMGNKHAVNQAIEGVVQLEAERVKGRNECRALLGRCRGHLSNYPERTSSLCTSPKSFVSTVVEDNPATSQCGSTICAGVSKEVDLTH